MSDKYRDLGSVTWTEEDEDGTKFGYDLNGLGVTQIPTEVFENNPIKVAKAYLRVLGIHISDDALDEDAAKKLVARLAKRGIL